MKKRLACGVILFGLPLFCLGGQLTPQVRSRAITVISELEKIEKEQAGRGARGGRTYTVSEDDLNAFVAYRIVSDQERYVKSCELKLQPQNRVEGKILIDVSGQLLTILLPPKVELLFSAGVETRAGKIRITMDNLFMGTQRLSPAFIDTVIAVVSGLEGVKATSLKDWYDLPYGIRRMETGAGRLVLCY